MSKSYDNTIGLWLTERDLKSAIARIVTDSRAPGEAKDTEGSALFELYRAFATPEETAAMREAYAGGIAWGEAKQRLFERIDSELRPMRERYYQLVSKPGEIEEILRFGGRKARALAIALVADVRMAVGIAPLFNVRWEKDKAAKSDRDSQPRFVSFRDDSGFRFKLLDGDGTLVLESVAFADPKACGQAVGVLKKLAVAGAAPAQRPGSDGGFELIGEDGAAVARGSDPARFAAVMEQLTLLAA
jgi:tryptophanyl-tRNA synthetase